MLLALFLYVLLSPPFFLHLVCNYHTRVGTQSLEIHLMPLISKLFSEDSYHYLTSVPKAWLIRGRKYLWFPDE